jgi:hypothetical protein
VRDGLWLLGVQLVERDLAVHEPLEFGQGGLVVGVEILELFRVAAGEGEDLGHVHADHVLGVEPAERPGERLADRVALVELLDMDLGVHPGEPIGQRPVRGSRPVVEQPGGGQHERAGAQARHPAAVGVRGAEGFEERGRREFGRVAPVRDDDQVRGPDRI